MKKKNHNSEFRSTNIWSEEIKICSVKGPWCGSTYIPIYTGIQKEFGCSQKWTENLFETLVKKYHRMTFFCFRSSSSILNVKKTCSINLSIVNSKVGISDGLFTQVLISEFNYYILDLVLIDLFLNLTHLIKCECSEAQPIIIINRTYKL